MRLSMCMQCMYNNMHVYVTDASMRVYACMYICYYSLYWTECNEDVCTLSPNICLIFNVQYSAVQNISNSVE